MTTGLTTPTSIQLLLFHKLFFYRRFLISGDPFKYGKTFRYEFAFVQFGIIPFLQSFLFHSLMSQQSIFNMWLKAFDSLNREGKPPNLAGMLKCLPDDNPGAIIINFDNGRDVLIATFYQPGETKAMGWLNQPQVLFLLVFHDKLPASNLQINLIASSHLSQYLFRRQVL